MSWNSLQMGETAILLLSCPDRKGIVARISNFIYRNNGNIVDQDNHTDHETNTFFVRVEWSMEGFKIKKEKLADRFSPLMDKLGADWRIHFSSELPQVAIFVSKRLHCLYDLLLRHREGQFRCEIPIIVSNHPDAAEVAKLFGIEFREFNITSENKLEQEREQLALLREKGVELVVLARYGQILTKQFVDAYPNRIISVHHSFLPAFVGKDAYEQAYRRGVKVIGATSHFVVEQLDQGSIIEQDVVRVSHKDSLQEFVRRGEDLEKLVLSRAVRKYLERKILVYDNKTIVFD